MSQVIFKGASFRESNFQWVNLVGANLRAVSLQRAVFVEARLCSAEFEDANVQGAIFRDADLTNANLANIHWDNKTNWEGAKGLDKALNVPKKLRQQLGLAEPEG